MLAEGGCGSVHFPEQHVTSTLSSVTSEVQAVMLVTREALVDASLALFDGMDFRVVPICTGCAVLPEGLGGSQYTFDNFLSS